MQSKSSKDNEHIAAENLILSIDNVSLHKHELAAYAWMNPWMCFSDNYYCIIMTQLYNTYLSTMHHSQILWLHDDLSVL